MTLIEREIIQGQKTPLPLADFSPADRQYLKTLAPKILATRQGSSIVLYTRAFAGTIQLSRLRLEIRPKIQPDAWRDTLFAMLSQVSGTQFTALPRTASYAASSTVFYETIRHFLNELETLASYGLLRRYTPHQERLPVVRGRLVLKEMAAIRFDGRLPCRYYDLSADIPDNRLIRTTVDRLQGLPLPADLSARAAGASMYFEGVRTCRADTPITYNRLNERYRPIHSLCRLLLQNLYTAFAAGPTPFTSFLVNMETLFEEYAAALLRRRLGSQYLIRTQTPARIPGAAENRVKSIILRPDILICDPSTRRPLLVLDTKYKVSTPLNQYGTETARHADFYQVLAYAVQYRCPGVLLYPQHEFSDAPMADIFTLQAHQIHLHTMNLAVPAQELGTDLIRSTQALLMHA